MRPVRRPFVPVTTHTPERDAELLSRLDDAIEGDEIRRRDDAGPTFETLSSRCARPEGCSIHGARS